MRDWFLTCCSLSLQSASHWHARGRSFSSACDLSDGRSDCSCCVDGSLKLHEYSPRSPCPANSSGPASTGAKRARASEERDNRVSSRPLMSDLVDVRTLHTTQSHQLVSAHLFFEVTLASTLDAPSPRDESDMPRRPTPRQGWSLLHLRLSQLICAGLDRDGERGQARCVVRY